MSFVSDYIYYTQKYIPDSTISAMNGLAHVKDMIWENHISQMQKQSGATNMSLQKFDTSYKQMLQECIDERGILGSRFNEQMSQVMREDDFGGDSLLTKMSGASTGSGIDNFKVSQNANFSQVSSQAQKLLSEVESRINHIYLTFGKIGQDIALAALIQNENLGGLASLLGFSTSQPVVIPKTANELSSRIQNGMRTLNADIVKLQSLADGNTVATGKGFNKVTTSVRNVLNNIGGRVYEQAVAYGAQKTTEKIAEEQAEILQEQINKGATVSSSQSVAAVFHTGDLQRKGSGRYANPDVIINVEGDRIVCDLGINVKNVQSQKLQAGRAAELSFKDPNSASLEEIFEAAVLAGASSKGISSMLLQAGATYSDFQNKKWVPYQEPDGIEAAWDAVKNLGIKQIFMQQMFGTGEALRDSSFTNQSSFVFINNKVFTISQLYSILATRTLVGNQDDIFYARSNKFAGTFNRLHERLRRIGTPERYRDSKNPERGIGPRKKRDDYIERSEKQQKEITYYLQNTKIKIGVRNIQKLLGAL